MDDVLTQTSFDKLLETLDHDREQAGAKYENLRIRLMKFFEWRGCETSEDLADTVFDRILKKISAGEQIQNIQAYSATVAQFVYKEHLRKPEKRTQSIDESPDINHATGINGFTDESADERLDCLDKCLAEFSAENRQIITAYYDTDERTMIESRKRLADSMAVSINTLRIRVCRLKTKLEDCMKKCCG